MIHGDQGKRNDRCKTLRRSFKLNCYKRRKLFSAPQQQTSTDQTKEGDGWLRDDGGTENSLHRETARWRRPHCPSRNQSLTNRSRGFCDVAASGSGGVRGAERGTLGCARASSCCDIHKYQRGKCRGGAAQTQPPTSDRNESFIWKAFTKIRERVSILFQKNFGSRFGEQEGAIHTFHPICAS